MNLRFVFLAIIGASAVIRSFAISHARHVSDQLKVLNSPELSYRYSVSLIDRSTGRIVDSNGGRLSRSGQTFVDSNKDFHTILTAQYFCKLDKGRKVASIYGLNALKKKLGIDPEIPTPTLSVVDSIGFKSPFPAIDSSGPGYYTVSWQLQSPTPSYFSLRVDKTTYRLLMVRIETTEVVDRDHSYNRVCVIRDIDGHAPQRQIDLTGIFRLEAGKVILNAKYSNYTIKSIID